MRLINKLTAGHIIVGFFVIAVALAGMAAINKIDLAFNEVSEQTLPVIETLENLRASGLKIGASASEFALIRAEIGSNVTTIEETEKEQVISAIKQYDAAISRYEEQVNRSFPEEKDLAESVKTSGNKLLKASNEIIALKEQGASGSIVLEKWEEFEDAKQEFQKAIDYAILHEHQELAERKQETENTIRTSIKTILFGGLLTFAVAIILGVYISRTISDPIIKLKDAAIEIGKGKLDKRVSIKSGDEVGILAACFNQMAQNLQQAGEELRHNEEHFRSLIENSFDAISILSSEGILLYTTPSVERMLGYKPEELIDKNIFEFIHPEDQQNVKKLVTQVIQTPGLTGSIDYRFLYKDGSWRDLESVGKSIIDPSGVVTVVINTRDITERKLAEEELRESEERYRTIIENSNDIIWTADIQGNFLFCNRRAEEISGYRLEEWRNKVYSPLIMKEELPYLMEVFSKVLKGQPQQYEASIKKRDGSVLILSINTAPLYSKGVMIGTVSFGRDITERKRIERELEEHREHLEELVNERTREVRLAKEEAERANMAKTNFLQTMSHELRTPLNAIIGFSELLKERTVGELNEKQVRFVDNIVSGGNNLNNILSQILEVVRMEKGTSELHIEKIPVPETIDSVIGAILEKAEKQNIVIEKNLDPQLEYIEADMQKFMQVLNNLLENAVKFSKQEGGNITITSKKEGDMARFSVSDTGIGIRKEDVGKLFEKFTQLDSGTARKYGGTGIGLAISKQFIEMHGGKIMVESKCGEGSTFSFLIPLKAKNGEI